MSFTCFNPFTVNPYFHTFPREKIPAQKTVQGLSAVFSGKSMQHLFGQFLLSVLHYFPG